MFKIILALSLVLSTATGWQHQEVDNTHSSDYEYEYAIDNYINLFRDQYNDTLKDYDKKIEYFIEHYSDRVKQIYIYLDLLNNNIVQIDERLNPLKVLSDHSNYCVIKHSEPIPTVLRAQNEIGKCVDEALDQIDTLMDPLINTNDVLLDHLTNNIDKKLVSCGENQETEELYFECISAAIKKANEYTTANQKIFEYQLDKANCNANAIIKRAFDCSYTFQYNVTVEIAKADLLIKNCRSQELECKPCQHSCVAALLITQDQLHDERVINPFVGRTDSLRCYNLIVQQNYNEYDYSDLEFQQIV